MKQILKPVILTATVVVFAWGAGCGDEESGTGGTTGTQTPSTGVSSSISSSQSSSSGMLPVGIQDGPVCQDIPDRRPSDGACVTMGGTGGAGGAPSTGGAGGTLGVGGGGGTGGAGTGGAGGIGTSATSTATATVGAGGAGGAGGGGPTVIACNPVTNDGCNTAGGEACDFGMDPDGNEGFLCFAPPNDQPPCGNCSNASGPYCTPKATCIAGDGYCYRYCCTNEDCGPYGMCTTGQFESVPGLGLCYWNGEMP